MRFLSAPALPMIRRTFPEYSTHASSLSTHFDDFFAHPAAYQSRRVLQTLEISNTHDWHPTCLFEYRSRARPENMMIAFCMMGALAVLVFLSISGEISNLFRRK